MYIESVPNRNSPPAVLLRESYRDPKSGKVKKRTLANLSGCDPAVVAGIKAVLKGAHASQCALEDQFDIERSLPHGHVAVVLGLFRQLGLPAVLDRTNSRDRSLAIALIVGRVLFPSSKLALSRHLDPDTATSTLGQELALGHVDEYDLYAAMRWLLERQPKIEAYLAGLHLEAGAPVLYDLTSTYYEGCTCVLAQFGHNRDGKKGKRQINFALLCNAEGCPIAVEVFPGNTSDPATVASQLQRLRERFGLKRVIVVGDRGMLTSARIAALEESNRSEGVDYGWISALRSDQIRKLVEADDIQLELFDEHDLAEVQSPELFPGERLVVCRNPLLAEERANKREQLLVATEAKLQEIALACRRSRAPYRGKDKIARRVERQCAKYKMLKHFELRITESGLEFARNEQSIAQEAALDGFYVIRAGNVGADEMTTNQIVETYKSLSEVERAFRAIKTISLKVRPIFHHLEEMVRAHIFLCMLAYYLQWHLENKLKAALFHDEEPGGAPRKSPVAKAKRSERGEIKVATKKTETGQTAHSLATLLEDLATLCRNTLRPAIKGAGTFEKLTRPTPIQARVFGLLGLNP